MWSQLPDAIIGELRASLDDLTADGEIFHMGSLFTGTGSEKLVMKVGIQQPAKENFDFPFEVQHEYSCDHGDIQQEFIQKVWPTCKRLFETVAAVAIKKHPKPPRNTLGHGPEWADGPRTAIKYHLR